MKLSVDRLRLLWEVGNRGSMSATARAIGYTPSAISQQLAQLEREAGTALLHRTSTGVSLTAAGRLLHQRASRILDELARAHADLAGTADHIGGSLRLAAFPTAVGHLVAPTLHALATRHPQLTVEVVDLEPDHAVAAVTCGDADLAITHHYDHLPAARPTHLVSHHLLTEPVHMAASSGCLPGSGPIDLTELADHRWIAPPRSSTCGDAVRHACHMAGFEPNIVITTDDLVLTAELVAARHGIALLPELATRARPTIDIRPLARPYGRIIELTARGGTYQHPNVQAVLAALEATIPTLLGTRDGRVPADATPRPGHELGAEASSLPVPETRA